MTFLLPPLAITTRLRRAKSVAVSMGVHGSAAALMVLFSALRPTVTPVTPPSEMEITYVAAPPGAVDTQLAEERDDSPPSTPGGAPDDWEATRFNIPKIKAQKESLFPFLTAGLTFLARLDKQAAASRDHLANPLAGSNARPPLLLTEAALQGVIDRSWSRRSRWRAFGEIVSLTETHDVNAGQLPSVLRGYLDQNLLQPFCDTTRRDSRFWAMLENAADHSRFIDFVGSFTRDHPASRTMTELLFLLDELTQASRDVMLMLMDTRPETDLLYTATTTRDGIALSVELRRYYLSWLAQHQLNSPEAVKGQFDKVRLQILATIIDASPNGYREGDARYLAGEIFFNQQNLDEAITWWKPIVPNAHDSYVGSYAAILSELREPRPNSKAIRGILQAEYARWRSASFDRLRQFHSRCDTF
jgi:hypothetical protein